MGRPQPRPLRELTCASETRNTLAAVAARRPDIFETMMSKGRIDVGQLECVRLLQDGLAKLARSTASGFAPVHVDRSRRLAANDAHLVSGIDLSAGIRDVLVLCGWSSRQLLVALLDPAADAASASQWKATVEKTTGAKDATEQSSRVRVACEDLQAALTSRPDVCRLLERAALS